ncbi:hypothetical protein GDO78_017494 [Eleutherodactylus coqui]|uniref:Uncharacterized protein n=1 Tax=Eleutherodactylus coqui TaxID=57060 RepID=A0A8J6E7G0_ELECQ|nr:hypothetical protein GDO78_017494 [Eleutherodactylus coqui]
MYRRCIYCIYMYVYILFPALDAERDIFEPSLAGRDLDSLLGSVLHVPPGRRGVNPASCTPPSFWPHVLQKHHQMTTHRHRDTFHPEQRLQAPPSGDTSALSGPQGI